MKKNNVAFRLMACALTCMLCMPMYAWADGSAVSGISNSSSVGAPDSEGDMASGDSITGSQGGLEGDEQGSDGPGDDSGDDPSSNKQPDADSSLDEGSDLPSDMEGGNDDRDVASGDNADGSGDEAESEAELARIAALDAEAAAAAEAGETNLPRVVTLASAVKRSQVVDVPGASSLNSAALQMYASNATLAQRFELKSLGGGYYSLINASSKKALDVRNAQASSGAVVQQYAANGTDAQAWKFVATGDGDGSYRIVSKLKATLVLTVKSTSASNGAALQLAENGNAATQKFYAQGYAALVKDGTYAVGSLATKTVLDVYGADARDGANIQMYESNGTAAQRFALKYDASTGCYTVQSLASGKVLDVVGAGAFSGANVQQYSSNGTAAQKWTIEKSSDGKGYVLLSACSGLALDIAAASSSNGANVQVYQRNGTAAQTWTFSTGGASNARLEGLYSVRASSNAGYVLDINGGSSANGANVQLYSSNGSWAQKFRFEMHDDTYCVIYSLSSGKALDVAYGGMKNGTNVHQYEFNGTDAQLWRPISYGGSTYGFQSKLNGLFLDVSSGLMADGANVQVWENNGSPAQKFNLSKTDTSSSVTEGSYLLKSVVDGTVVDMVGAGTSNGTKAQLYASNGTFAQKFKVLSAGSGSYYFVNVHSSKYLDVDTGSKTILQQWDRGEGANQKWVFYPVAGGSGTYYIKSSYTGAYLTNSNGVLGLSPYAGTNEQRFKLEGTQAFKVYLDAGHGYNSNGDGRVDVGAVGLGYRECDLTTDLVKRIASQLDKLGIEYYIGYGKSYKTRHQDAVNMGCSTFLSIHFNSSTGAGTGVESFIHSYNASPGSPTFQNVIHPYLVNGVGLFDRGTKRAELAVCGGRLPSVLCEIAFINNTYDMGTYQQRKDTVALELARGLVQASKNAACGWY